MAIIDNTKLFESIEEKIKGLNSCLNEQLVREPFTKDFALRFCWSSNAIEGNTLSLEETVSLIVYDEVHSGHTYSEYQEAKGLYSAISKLMVPFQKREITEEWVKEANSLVMGWEGEYRTDNVYIGNLVEAVYYPPSWDLVPALMKDYMKKVNFKENSIQKAIEEIATQHIKFERIHPFHNGNGRVGRMILNQQLINNDLLPICIKPTGKYRQAFRSYEKNNDISLLVHVLGKAEEESADLVLGLKRESAVIQLPR